MPVCAHIETSQLICFANQLTGFYMRAKLAFNELPYLTENQIFFSENTFFKKTLNLTSSYQ